MHNNKTKNANDINAWYNIFDSDLLASVISKERKQYGTDEDDALSLMGVIINDDHEYNHDKIKLEDVLIAKSENQNENDKDKGKKKKNRLEWN